MVLVSSSHSNLLLPLKPSPYSSSKSIPLLFTSTNGKIKTTKIRSVGIRFRNLTPLDTEATRRTSRTRKKKRLSTIACSSAETEPPGRWFPHVFLLPERMKVLCLVALVMCLCNADRVVMSVAAMPLCTEHAWSTPFLGVVQVLLLFHFIQHNSISLNGKLQIMNCSHPFYGDTWCLRRLEELWLTNMAGS